MASHKKTAENISGFFIYRSGFFKERWTPSIIYRNYSYRNLQARSN